MRIIGKGTSHSLIRGLESRLGLHIHRHDVASARCRVIKGNKTSTTPSCGRPLRAQIFRKVCFYEQKYDFWHVRVPFALFNPPPKLIKKQKFSQMIFFLFFFCHIEPTCQKLCFYNKNCKFWPLGPLLPYLKGPPNSSKTEIFKNYNFFCFTLSH